MSLTTEAIETAKALVTASLVGDMRACRTLIPEDHEEAAHLMIALSMLGAKAVSSLASQRGIDAVEMWREAMLNAASTRC